MQRVTENKRKRGKKRRYIVGVGNEKIVSIRNR